MRKWKFTFTLPILLALILIGSSCVFAENNELPSLREIYKDYFPIGGAIAVASWGPKTLVSHRALIKRHLSSLTAENAMKPDYLQPRPGYFNFTEADQLIAYAQENDMLVRGHTLVWHGQTPDWFFRDKSGQLIGEKDKVSEEDRQLVIERMEAHIEAVMTHFGDSVYAWDVANEVVTDDTAHIHRQDSPWVRTVGEDFIKIAFRKAHEVDPDAKLFYNDYNAVAPYKRGRIIAMLEDMINDGVPIHGMGFQAHWSVDGPSISEIEDAIKMYSALGLEIHITEMDVGMEGATEEEQAERYREFFQLFKKYSDVITNVTLWGVADDASWRGDENPLLFDKNHDPKPAFWALVDTDKPWYVNKAEHLGAVSFRNDAGEEVGTLKTGDYSISDLGFNLQEVGSLDVIKGHLISFYELANLQGKAWHFVSEQDFDGTLMAAKAKSFSIRHIEANNVVLERPVQANVLEDRAQRAVDGNKISSWSPSGEPPYWLAVDLGNTYLLNRWAVRLQGTGPLAGGVQQDPLNAKEFKLQVSADGITWEDADFVVDNVLSVYERELNLVEARYVRLYVTEPTSLATNKGLVVYEFEVYGLPVEE